MLREHFEHGVKTSGLRGAQGPKKTIPGLRSDPCRCGLGTPVVWKERK